MFVASSFGLARRRAAAVDSHLSDRGRIGRNRGDPRMDAKIARLETEIDKLRADLARANVTVRALQGDVQAARAELSSMSWPNSPARSVYRLSSRVIVLIVINASVVRRHMAERRLKRSIFHWRR